MSDSELDLVVQEYLAASLVLDTCKSERIFTTTKQAICLDFVVFRINIPNLLPLPFAIVNKFVLQRKGSFPGKFNVDLHWFLDTGVYAIGRGC
jgi:hypothetical protein